MSPASMNARSSASPPTICRLLRSAPAAHWIANSTSSATSSSEEYGSRPSSAAKYRSKKLISRLIPPTSGRGPGPIDDRLDHIALDHLQRRSAGEILEHLDRLRPGVLRQAFGLEERLQLA